MHRGLMQPGGILVSGSITASNMIDDQFNEKRLKQIVKHIGFWLLLPLSALQGLLLRQSAPRMPEAAGDRTGVCGQGEQLKLLAMGDSIIVGVGLQAMQQSLPVQFATALANQSNCRVQWQLEGKNGADIAYLRQQIAKLDQNHAADIILISIGVNDVTGLISKRAWRIQLETLLGELQGKWPHAFVIFAGLPPMGKFPLPPQPLRFTLGQRAENLDNIAAELISKQRKMQHIRTTIDPLKQSFCEDGFHPSAESCSFWAVELAQRLEADNLHGKNSKTRSQ
jgi:lysophospholipase L1-like esterase